MEEKVMKLFGLAWSKAPAAEVRATTAVLLKEQRADGGWSQLTTLDSDAYATGKAMVALVEAASIRTGSEAYRRGVQYLLNTQHADGSWLVKTRAFALQPLKDSGFPHGRASGFPRRERVGLRWRSRMQWSRSGRLAARRA